jgi:organic radical activating enzyme
MDQRKVDYLDFKKKVLDPISSTFCAAKWFEVTLWLYMRSGASCHHNPSHKIELSDDPSTLHNTEQKIAERNMMLSGKRVDGCRYCWDAEDSGIVSDRMMKSYGYDWSELNSNIPIKVNPKKIEIAFSRTCQLACAYCGPSFSSTWANDLSKNGSYNLKSNTRFNKDIKDKLIPDSTNQYIDEFFKWWKDLKHDLQVLRFTGGEPLLQPRFWEFLDLLDSERDYKNTFIVNSNLVHDKGQVQRFIDKTKFMTDAGQRVEIHTSCESSLADAEYTRDGFDGELWYKNVIHILDNSKIKLTFTTAINNMSIWSFREYLNMIATLKTEYGESRIQANFNRVLYPQWHSLPLIPKQTRIDLANELKDVFDNLHILHDSKSVAAFGDLYEYLNSSEFSDPAFSEQVVLTDMVSFYDQFNLRRKKDVSLLDRRYVAWMEQTRKELTDG